MMRPTSDLTWLLLGGFTGLVLVLIINATSFDLHIFRSTNRQSIRMQRLSVERNEKAQVNVNRIFTESSLSPSPSQLSTTLRPPKLNEKYQTAAVPFQAETSIVGFKSESANKWGTSIEVYNRALSWIAGQQHTSNCSNSRSMILGTQGGFASNFQSYALVFGDVLGNSEVAVPTGHFGPYTNNPTCTDYAYADNGLHSRTSINCFFRLPSNCTTGQLPRIRDTIHKGKSRSLQTNMEALLSITPKELPRSRGFWWGAIQGYLFRLNDRMETRLKEVKSQLGFTLKVDIAAHIRVGDKLGDANSRQQEQNLGEYVNRYLQQIDKWVKKLKIEKAPNHVLIYVASDSTDAINRVNDWAKTRDEYVRLFSRMTASQQIAKKDMTTADLMRTKNISERYILAEEIIVDMHLLVGTRYFVGLCMSQIARVVVSIGFATGSLVEAVAMDYPDPVRNLNFVDKSKLGSDMPWSVPQ